jgi:hypothetical protein
MGIGGFCYGI